MSPAMRSRPHRHTARGGGGHQHLGPLGQSTASRLRFRRIFLAALLAFGLLIALMFAFTGGTIEGASSMAEDAGDGGGQGGGGVWGWLTKARRKKRKLWHPKFPGMGRRKSADQAPQADGAAAGKAKKSDGAKSAVGGGGTDAFSEVGGDGHGHGRVDVKPKKGGGGAGKKKNRIAIVIPYLPPPQTQTGGATPALPPYFPVFARTAGGSSSLIDFLIFHDGSIPSHLLPPTSPSTSSSSGGSSDPYAEAYALPSNVKLIDAGGIDGMAKLFLRVADERIKSGDLEMDEERLVKVMGRHIRGYPYVLVEFKAAYGHVFEEYLTEYSHWGYSDLDVAFGDLPRWISPDELNDYDIVTYGYGDQDRAYLRGQFTFHRNVEKTRQVWRGCKFLSEIDRRFARAAAGTDKLKFESAEGCYSHVVLHRDDLSVKYAVKGLNDLGDEGDTAYTHGLYVGVGARGDRSVVWKAGPDEGDGARMRDLPLDWFEAKGSPYAVDSGRPLQREVGERVRIHSHRDKYGDDGKKVANCMFWAPKHYQPDICLVDVAPTDTVFLIDGKLYKQPYERVEMPGNVVSLSFYHFMEWKRYYRPTQLASMSRSPTDGGIGGWVLGGEGAVPLPPPPSSVVASDKNSLQVALESAWGGGGTSVFRRRPHLSAATGTEPSTDDRTAIDRTRYPPTTFCLRSSQRKVPPRPAAAQCDYFTSWRDANGVRIIREGDDRTKSTKAVGGDESSVTLVLTVQLGISSLHPSESDLDRADGLLALAESNVRAWSRGGQPSVLVIYAGSYSSDAVDVLVQNRFGAEKGIVVGGKAKKKKTHLSMCLVASVSPTEIRGKDVVAAKDDKNTIIAPVSRRALQNLAGAAAWTRWVVVGLEAERGLVLSAEAVGFARRTAGAHHAEGGGGRTGLAFVLPQLAAREGAAFGGEVPTEPGGRGTRTTVDPVPLSRLLRDGGVLEDDSAVTSRLSSFDCATACSRKKRKGRGDGDDPSSEVDLADRALRVWLDATLSELSDSAKAEYAGKASDVVKGAKSRGHSVEELERAAVDVLAENNYESLRSWDASPLVMLDQIGPRSGLRTSEIAPEVEEFGGGSGHCFGALRLANLAALGYRVAVLPGAFAVSTAASRTLACAGRDGDEGAKASQESSQCRDGCSMFKNDGLLEDMAYDERIRPAKAAVLWSELEQAPSKTNA